ncbi:MAG TPA: tetratricopeptide repeat protein [Pyrinomonadaceae bacterium]|jgi:TolB-like protein/Flp pilus assembly protein TadD|nr:tetratricopeptide repeat protein [Pyrinomonadaceae bacterium]
MKRCPSCQRTYLDDSLNFCRDDGTSLVWEQSPQYDSPQGAGNSGMVRDTGSLPTRVFGAGPAAAAYGGSLGLLAPQSHTLPLPPRRPTRRAIDSLAVLPLVNDSADADMEYFSDGVTENIINSLAQLPKLRVVPRSTVFRYKGSNIDPQEVGQLLGVRAVLTGRFRQVGDRLIFAMELIDVANHSQLWGESYNRERSDIFAVQEEIAKEISEKLSVKLNRAEKKRLIKRYTENTEAYHLYLKGRYYVNRRTGEWLKKGIDYFQKAIKLDPNYALAYAGLADAHALLGSSTGGLPPKETFPKAKAAALKALEIDKALCEAHTSLGFSKLLYDWDFAGARQSFKRAIKLNPGYASAHDGYGFYLKAAGRHDEAIHECKQVQKLDPLSLFAHVSLGWAYYFAHRYTKAIEQGRKALEMDPQFAFAYRNIGLSFIQRGEIEDAISALSKALELSGNDPTYKSHLGYAYAMAGRLADAEQVIKWLKKVARKKYVPAYYFAIIYLGLDVQDEMFKWLERAFEERSGFMAFLHVEPMFDHLREDPRLVDLVERVGLGK